MVTWLRTVEQELGYFALAVVQAGAYISRSECGLRRYLEMYQERRGELLEEYRNQVQKVDDYEWTVYTTWTMSFERLSPLATTFLKICAFLHHDGISEAMFQNAASNLTSYVPHLSTTNHESDSLSAAKEFLDSFRTTGSLWDTQKFLKVVKEIRSYSLIDFDPENRLYSVHPLVHAWTFTIISNAELVRTCTQYILSLSCSQGFNLEDYTFRRTLLPHVDAALQGGTNAVPDVAARLQFVYVDGGRWKEAEKLQVLVVETMKRVLGEENPDTLTSMANLASTYRKQGRWKEAEVLEVLVMDTRKRVLGEEHPDTLTSMANLASTYRKQGRWKEAEVLEVLVMDTRKRVLGEEHPDTLTSMANLASTYRKQGRWKEAEVLEVLVVDTRKRVIGEEHPDTLMSMANLASTYQNQGRWKEAEALEVLVMDTMKRVLGEEHPDTLTSMANLASTYWRQGRWKEAEALEVLVMDTMKRALGEGHPDTLTSMANLASTYWKQGRWKE